MEWDKQAKKDKVETDGHIPQQQAECLYCYAGTCSVSTATVISSDDRAVFVIKN